MIETQRTGPRRLLAAWLLVLAGTPGVAQNAATGTAGNAAAAAPSPGYVVRENIPYGFAGPGSCGTPGAPQCLDLYVPGVRAPGAPTLVWVHGSGFANGDKQSLRVRRLCQAVAKAGVPAVAINFTLAKCGLPPGQGASFPQNVFDVKLALRWVRTAGRAYDLSPCVLLAGSSSGGILATLCGTAWDVEEYDPLGATPHALDLYRPNLVVAFSVLPDLQERGCVGATIDPACAQGSPLSTCGNCAPVGDGCCKSMLSAPPAYASGGSVPCWLGPWTSDCGALPDATSMLNTWVPGEPYLNASATHWLGFSDVGALTTGLEDPPIVLVQRRCDLVGSPADGAAFRAASIAQGGIVEVVDYLDTCRACGHGAAEPLANAQLALDVWNDPQTWFASFSEPASGYLNCP